MLLISIVLTGLLAIFPSGISAGTGKANSASPTVTASPLKPQGSIVPFSQACIAWKIVASKVVGKGWILSGFCKNVGGIYYWDDDNLVDFCVGADNDGHLVHKFHGHMSYGCSECNNKDGW